MVTAYGYVYAATCRTTGKSYVGQTTGPIRKRWKRHLHGNSVLLARAIKKYGFNDFSVREMERAGDAVALDAAEKKWIVRLGTLVPDGYNLKEGGANGKPSIEARRKMSEAHRGKTPDPETRKRMAEAQRARRNREAAEGGGPVFTKESRRAMSEARLGTRHSEETKRKMGDARRGKRPTVATREKLRAAARKREQAKREARAT